MKSQAKAASLFSLLIMIIFIIIYLAVEHYQATTRDIQQAATPVVALPSGQVTDALDKISVKGRSPKTGYARAQFGDGWETRAGCDTRNTILRRDLTATTLDAACRVVSGVLNDPYSGLVINFTRGVKTSEAVQIDHVVALSDAWQKGAQLLSIQRRIQFANDPLNLQATDGSLNQQKSDSDAASWLPPNKAYRCTYVSRQIAVKLRYELWITEAEKNAMDSVLVTCPGIVLPTE